MDEFKYIVAFSFGISFGLNCVWAPRDRPIDPNEPQPPSGSVNHFVPAAGPLHYVPPAKNTATYTGTNTPLTSNSLPSVTSNPLPTGPLGDPTGPLGDPTGPLGDPK